MKCTWDALTGKADEKADLIRKNPRKVWYSNLKDVTVGGDTEVDLRARAGRSRRSCRCWPPATRRSMPASANGRDMRSSHRHRSVQGRGIQAATNRSSWCAIRTTGRRVGPISTRSTEEHPNRSDARAGSWPANST